MRNMRDPHKILSLLVLARLFLICVVIFDITIAQQYYRDGQYHGSNPVYKFDNQNRKSNLECPEGTTPREYRDRDGSIVPYCRPDNDTHPYTRASSSTQAPLPPTQQHFRGNSHHAAAPQTDHAYGYFSRQSTSHNSHNSQSNIKPGQVRRNQQGKNDYEYYMEEEHELEEVDHTIPRRQHHNTQLPYKQSSLSTRSIQNVNVPSSPESQRRTWDADDIVVTEANNLNDTTTTVEPDAGSSAAFITTSTETAIVEESTTIPVSDRSSTSDIATPAPADVTTTQPPPLQTSIDEDDNDGAQQSQEEIEREGDDDRSTSQEEVRSESSPDTNDNHETSVSIIVTGRSGSGVSSTIRELIGPHTKCQKPEGTETLQNIYQYTISGIPTENGRRNVSIKLLDLPGFIDGRTLEKDAQILATLKSYIIDNGPPNFFLALSRFDDNRIIGDHSLFTQFIKRLELIDKVFLEPFTERRSDIVFLLTRLMSETRTNQRRPATKIETFKQVIQRQTTFPPPISIVVGDNQAVGEHDAKVEGGYYKLPNKELYPKNVWDALVTSAKLPTTNQPDQSVHFEEMKTILNLMKDNRETEMKCEANLIHIDWLEYNSDANAFLSLLQQHPIPTPAEDNEVNRKIDEVFESKLTPSQRRHAIVQKIALQVYLQNNNFTEIKDLPQNYAGKAALFQKSLLVSSSFPALLLMHAFGLQMPEYIQSLTVGYGYDVMADEISFETPFELQATLPSPVGYQLPDFMRCRKYPASDIVTFQSYSHNMSEYFQERMKYLRFDDANKPETISEESFTGKVKEGFNMQPEGDDSNVALLGVKEFRLLKCSLADMSSLQLSQEFKDRINSLTPLDRSQRDSVNEWKIFLQTYGTHIVMQGYGGGSLHGNIVGPNVKHALESQDNIDSTLDSILKFLPFSIPNIGKPSYRLFGGEASPKLNQLYDLPEAERDQVLKEWESSLNSNFVMLSNEFQLERISNIVKRKIHSQKGRMIDEAIDLFLRGELVKIRKKPNANAGGGGGNEDKKGDRFKPKPTQITPQRPSTPRPYTPSSQPPPLTQSLLTPPPTSFQNRPTDMPKRNELTQRPSYDRNPYNDNYHRNPTTNGHSQSLDSEEEETSSFSPTLPPQYTFPNIYDSNSMTIDTLQQTILNKGKEYDEMHRRQLNQEQQRQNETMQAKKNRSVNYLRNSQQAAARQRQFHEQTMEGINRQAELDRNFTDSQIDYIRRINDEEEAKHRLLMAELEKQAKKKENECKGWNWFKCAARTVTSVG